MRVGGNSMLTEEMPIRLPQNDEEGIEFIDWLNRRLAGDRIARQRMVAFIEEWDHLRDEIRDREMREPTVEEYARRWNVAESSAYRLLDEFRRVVGMDYPGRLCQLLWDGMPKWTGRGPIPDPKWLLAIEVVPSA
jgi:hypothetical protein